MVDRTSFFTEQDKRRSQVWRLSALSFLLLLCTGMPLAMVVTPLVLALVAVVTRLLDFLLPIPADFWEGLRTSMAAAAANEQPLAENIISAAVLFSPGIAVIAWVWWRLRQGLQQAGSAWMVTALEGRELRTDDFEETQFANLADEVAIAAGIAPPPVFIVDDPAPNAAVVGPNDQDAAFIVTRGLLDRLDRDASQAVVGYLMAGVRQGNLEAATAVITAFHAFGLVLLVFDACFNFSRQSWSDLRRVARWLAHPERHAGESHNVLSLLERIDPPEDGLTGLQADLMSDESPRTRLAAILRTLPVLYVVLLPALLVYIVFMFIRFELFLLRTLLVGPVLVLAWRQRVHLADAAAVQLTRNAQALANALQAFRGFDATGLDSRWLAAYCFIGAEPKSTSKRIAEEPGVLPPHPASLQRLRRVVAMGAAVDVEPAPRFRLPTWAELRQGSLWSLLLIPLVLLVGYLLLVVIGLVLGLATLFSLFFVLLVLNLISTILP